MKHEEIDDRHDAGLPLGGRGGSHGIGDTDAAMTRGLPPGGRGGSHGIGDTAAGAAAAVMERGEKLSWV